MKIIVLSDNRSDNPDKFKTEHGLSIYLDLGYTRWLLDTGRSNQFIENAERMKIDLTTVDYVFLSHGHIDHTGGLDGFMSINTKAKVILSAAILKQKFYSLREELHSLSPTAHFCAYANRLIPVESTFQLTSEISVFSVTSKRYNRPFANRTLLCDKGDGPEQDPFDHELIISFGTSKPLLFTGCCHGGLLNILDTFLTISPFPPAIVLGGFHLLDSTSRQFYETEQEIDQISFVIKNKYTNTLFITGHCTGNSAFKRMQAQLHEQIGLFHTGYKIDFRLQ